MDKTWVLQALPQGSRERSREKRVLAGKESWLTRRWNERRRKRIEPATMVDGPIRVDALPLRALR